MELIHTTSFWNEDTSDVQVFGIEKMLEKLDAGKMPKMIAIQVGGASWRAKISEQLEKYTELGGVAVFVPEKWDSGAQSSLVKTKKGVYHLQHKEGDSAVSARNLLYGIASAAGFPEFESDGLGKTVLPDSLVLRGDDKLEYTLEAKVRRGWVFGSFNVSGKTVKIQKGTFDTQTGITYLALRDQSIIRGFYKGQRFNGSLHLESTDKPIILEEIK
jgi:hypothetical protein